MIRSIIIRFFFFLFAASAVVSDVRELVEGPFSPSGTALGQGSLPRYSVEGGFFNPALLSLQERTGGALGGGMSDSFRGGWGHFFFPGSLGNFGLSGAYVQDSTGIGLLQFSWLQLGYSRFLTRSLAFGFYLKPGFGKTPAGEVYSIGLEPALLHRVSGQLETASGFGLYDFHFYFLPKNLSGNFGPGNEFAPSTSVHLGTQGAFFRKGDFETLLSLEAWSSRDFSRLPVSSGLTFRYAFLHLRGGWVFSETGTVHAGPSLGAGLDFGFANGNLAANYSFLPQSGNRTENFHFISLSGTYGYIDVEPPEVSLKTDTSHFSPNYDGRKDYVNFELGVKDYSPIRSWELSLFDINGKKVRTFANDLRVYDRPFSIRRISEEFFTSREALVVPRKIRWDGTADLVTISQAYTEEEDKKPVVRLPDGVYSYRLTVTDARGNISKPVAGSLVLDTKPPTAKLSLERGIFSPNGDGALDQITVFQETWSEPDDRWRLSVINADGEAVFKKEIAGKDLSDSFIWDGNDNGGNPVAEGIYRYKLTGEDEAGNSVEKNTGEFTLVRAKDSASLAISATGISPDGNGTADFTVIKPELSGSKDLTRWKLVISSKAPEKDEAPDALTDFEGSSIPPAEIRWEGKNRAGQVVNDGAYYAVLYAWYRSGNHPVSFPVKIMVDRTPPEPVVEAESSFFSPDGDGEDENQSFAVSIDDDSELKSYNLKIWEITYDEDDKKERNLIKTFSGEGTYPNRIPWDGKTDAGNLLESAATFEYQLEAEDIYGNTAKSQIARFETDILVTVTDRGLKIRLSNIRFDRGKYDIRPDSKGLLQRLAHILKRYPAYMIRVEGHTDNRGSEEYNLKLSENRARSVMQFLISEGIEEERITYQGLGEIEPIVPNNTDYNRSKNRRVEFQLIKR